MKLNSPKLFIKIDHYEISYIAADIDDNNNFSLLEEIILPTEFINDNKITDLKKITDQIKKNILKIEENINFTFKEVIIILNSFTFTFLNITGYKHLNGSQILKENITYIINSLKSCINENEIKKNILHIFNTKYQLDKKTIDNIPVGLFGNFYTHELSFNLINKNDLKNLKTIFDTCNIKIKKILTESFVKGALISDTHQKVETFLFIQLSKTFCKVFYVENDSIKFDESFKFGTNLIIKDISKITNLKNDKINDILRHNIFTNKNSENEFIEKKFFDYHSYRKIKKDLILDIAEARICEFTEVLLSKNINFKNFFDKSNLIFLEINDSNQLNCFKELYRQCFSFNNKFQVKMLDKLKSLNLVEFSYRISEFGWKKEAIPILTRPKSLITRIFQGLFR